MKRILYFFSLVVFTVVADSEWGYIGINGPSHWAEDNPICADTEESPIDILTNETQYDSGLTPFTFTGYDAIPAGAEYKMENNGHSAEVHLSADASNAYSVSGGGLPTTYYADQFHFHWGSEDGWGSEHTVDQRTYPMEMHIVHHSSLYSKEAATFEHEGLVVLGFFFEVGRHNDDFNEVVTHLKNITSRGEEVELEPFRLSSLFPSDMTSYWRYGGSLTTPPCAESVIWTVFQTPIEIGEDQLAAFRMLYFDSAAEGVRMQNNFRPTQPDNGRIQYTSVESNCVRPGMTGWLLFAFLLFERLLNGVVQN